VPVAVVEAAGAGKSSRGKISWRQIEGFNDYEDRWHSIQDFLAAKLQRVDAPAEEGWPRLGQPLR
jgi:hypothetical protein